MTRSLDDYNRMRDFSATSEPAAGKRSGKKKAKDHALQFCITQHFPILIGLCQRTDEIVLRIDSSPVAQIANIVEKSKK